MNHDPSHHSHGDSEVLLRVERVLEGVIHRLERALDQVIPLLATKADLLHTEQTIIRGGLLVARTPKPK